MKKLWYGLVLLLPALNLSAQRNPVIHYPLNADSVYAELFRDWDLLSIKGQAHSSTDRHKDARGALSLAPGTYVELQDLQQLAKNDASLSDSIFSQHLSFSMWLRYSDPFEPSQLYRAERYPGDPTAVNDLDYGAKEGYYSSYLYGTSIANDTRSWDYNFHPDKFNLRPSSPQDQWIKLTYVSSEKGVDLYLQVPDSTMPNNPYRASTYTYHNYLPHNPMNDFIYWYLGYSRNPAELSIDDLKFYDRMLEASETDSLLLADMGDSLFSDTTRNCYHLIRSWNDSVLLFNTNFTDALLDSALNYSDSVFTVNQDTVLYFNSVNHAFTLADSVEFHHDSLLTAWNDSAYAVCDSLFEEENDTEVDCYTEIQDFDLMAQSFIDSLHTRYLDSAYAYNDSVLSTTNDTAWYNLHNANALSGGDSLQVRYNAMRQSWIDSARVYCDSLNTPIVINESTCYNYILNYSDSTEQFNEQFRQTYIDSCFAVNATVYPDSTTLHQANLLASKAGDSLYKLLDQSLQSWVDSAFASCDSIHIPPPPAVVNNCYEELVAATDSLEQLIQSTLITYEDSTITHQDSLLALYGDTTTYNHALAQLEISLDSLEFSYQQQLALWADTAYSACGVYYFPTNPDDDSDCYGQLYTASDSLYSYASSRSQAFLDSVYQYEQGQLAIHQDTALYNEKYQSAAQTADSLLSDSYFQIQLYIDSVFEHCHRVTNPSGTPNDGNCYEAIYNFSNRALSYMDSLRLHILDSINVRNDSLYAINNDELWYQTASRNAVYVSDSVYQHLDAFRVSWMDLAYTACDSIFNYQPADGPASPSDEDCYTTISAHYDSAYAYMDSLRMAFTDSAYAYNDSVYAYDNHYGQYEYNLNLIYAQSDSIYYFYDAQLMSWNDSAYAYCDSLANSCTDQIMTWQDSIWSYNESIETTMMDSVQAYHHTLFAADHNYIQYLINANEATSYVDSILDIDRERFSLQVDSAFAYCDSLNPNEMDPCYGPVQLWMDSTYSYHNSLMSLYLDSANSWNDNDHSNRYENQINAFIAMATNYNDSSNNWWSANVITPWGDSTHTFYNNQITALEDSARSWNDMTYTIGDSTHTWNDSIITYQVDSAQTWANQLVLYGTDSLWNEALSGVILWTDSMINWASGIFDSDNDSIYVYHDQNIMAWSDSAWTAVNDIVNVYTDSAYAYCDSLYNPPMPVDTSCHGLVMAYSDSIFYYNDNMRIMYIDSAFAYNDSVYMVDNDDNQRITNNDFAMAQADSLFMELDAERIAWTDSAYAYCDSILYPSPGEPEPDCHYSVSLISDSIFFYNDNLRSSYIDSALVYHDSVYAWDNDYETYQLNSNYIWTYSDSVYTFNESLRMAWADSAYAYCDSVDYFNMGPCYGSAQAWADSTYGYYDDVRIQYTDSAYSWNYDDFNVRSASTTQTVDSIVAYRDSIEYDSVSGNVMMWVDSTTNCYASLFQSTTDSAYSWNNATHTYGDSIYNWYDNLIISQSDSSYNWLNQLTNTWQDSVWAVYYDNFYAWSDSVYSHWSSLYDPYQDSIFMANEASIITASDSIWLFGDSLVMAYQDSANAYCDSIHNNPTAITTQVNVSTTVSGGLQSSVDATYLNNGPSEAPEVNPSTIMKENPSEPMRLTDFSVFPNPAYRKVHILYESPRAQRISIFMAQTDGRLLHFETVEIPAGRYTYTFPLLSELTSKFSLLQSVVVGLKTEEGNLSEIILIE